MLFRKADTGTTELWLGANTDQNENKRLNSDELTRSEGGWFVPMLLSLLLTGP